jgi:hypothetical protein
MAETKQNRMIYLGGHAASKALVGILAFPEDFSSETEYTVFYISKADEWTQLTFDFDIAALTYLELPHEKYEGWWLVGKRGEIVEIVDGNQRIFRIETAGTGSPEKKYGYLHQIRVIDNELFICGYRRQVYRRHGNSWDLISADILDRRSKRAARWFESIDGFSKNDLYAVGSRGEIWHFNGRKWTQCDSPTNQHLADVRCLDGKIWVCGDGGIILCGDQDRWEVIWDDEEPSENWWNVEKFQGHTYVAGSLMLARLEDEGIVQIDVGIKDDITAQTLQRKDGILWSIGAEDILSYDGKEWKELICPDNR